MPPNLMQFREFFPRLQRRALERYGVQISERQFKDWREDGLLPGPLAPKGRGRGRSPERHWPPVSYRRALRICRYKGWGAGRQSQWWLAFWLSGEAVNLDKIRAALNREFSIERRAARSWLESSGRQPSKPAELGDTRPIFGNRDIDPVGLAKLIKTEPCFRNAINASIEENSSNEIENLMREIMQRVFGKELLNEVEKYYPIAPDAPISHWRPGHLNEGSSPGRFIDDISQEDLLLSAAIIQRKRSYFHVGLTLARKSNHKEILLLAGLVLGAAMHHFRNIVWLIEQIICTCYAVHADRLDGVNPISRVKVIEGDIKLLRIIYELSK